MASGRLVDYLGSGVIADRPASLSLAAGTVGLWWATDTDLLSAWDGASWTTVSAGAGSAAWGSITGTLSSQTDLQNALNAKNNLGETAGLNAQSGTTYTLVLADKGKMIENTNASAITTTVPPNSSVAFPVNSIVYVAQGGAGQVTVAAGAGVTLKPATVKTRAQDSILAIVKTGTDTWRAMGDMA